MIVGWSPNRFECNTDPTSGKFKFWFFSILWAVLWSTPCIQARFWGGSWSRILISTTRIDPEDIFLQDIGWRSCLRSIKQLYRRLKYACSHVVFSWNHGFSYKIRGCASDPQPQFLRLYTRFSQGSWSRMFISTSPIDSDRFFSRHIGRRVFFETFSQSCLHLIPRGPYMLPNFWGGVTTYPNRLYSAHLTRWGCGFAWYSTNSVIFGIEWEFKSEIGDSPRSLQPEGVIWNPIAC